MNISRIKFKTHLFLYVLILSILFALALYRSVVLDFTNDEAFSFLNVDQLNIHMMYGTANTHWLNTVFMFFENLILGHSEWALRIHSVIAVIFFGWYLIRLFDQTFKIHLVFIPMSILLMNMYLFDYFSLARGYALSMMFEMMAFYFITKNSEEDSTTIYLLLSLATLSNYTCIYFLYSFLLLDLFNYYSHNNIRSIFSIQFFKKIWPLILISIWALPNIIFIKYVTNDLREGEKNGFIKDSLCEFFERSYPVLNESNALLLCTILFVALLLFYFFFKHSMHQGFRKLIGMMLICFLAIELCFLVLHIPYPYGRTAFFIIIPFLVACAYMLVFLINYVSLPLQSLCTLVIVGISFFYTIQQYDTRSMIEYWQQQGIKQCFADLYKSDPSHIKQLKVGMSIDHYGSFLNYYKYLNPSHYPDSCFVYSRDGYDQLKEFEVVQFKQQDYLLMIGDYKTFLQGQIATDHIQLLQHYPYMKTDLLKVAHFSKF